MPFLEILKICIHSHDVSIDFFLELCSKLKRLRYFNFRSDLFVEVSFLFLEISKIIVLKFPGYSISHLNRLFLFRILLLRMKITENYSWCALHYVLWYLKFVTEWWRTSSIRLIEKFSCIKENLLTMNMLFLWFSVVIDWETYIFGGQNCINCSIKLFLGVKFLKYPYSFSWFVKHFLLF